MFKKYHYLNIDINSSSESYILTYKDNPCSFIAIIHQPHPINARIKRVHRLVTLPDYQGIGLGKLLLESVGGIYKEKGFFYHIITSNPSLMYYFNNSNKWLLYHKGRYKKHTGSLNKTGFESIKRITTGWRYVG